MNLKDMKIGQVISSEDTYTGTINKIDSAIGDKPWQLKIDSIEFLMPYSDAEIEYIMSNTLAEDNKYDFANDGETYKFSVKKFDNYVMDKY